MHPQMEKIKKINSKYILYISILMGLVLLAAFYINNYKKTIELEEELARINREIYQNQINSKKREKEFTEEENKLEKKNDTVEN